MARESTKKKVRLVLEADFEGRYYEARELVPVLDEWVGAGLEDRDDLRGYRVVASSVEVEGVPERGTYVNGDSGYLELRCGVCEEILTFVEAGTSLVDLVRAETEHQCGGPSS